MHFPPQGTALHLQYRATSATVPTQLLWDHIWGVRSQLWSIWKESQHHTKTNSKNPWPVQNISWPFKPETDPLVKGIIFPVSVLTSAAILMHYSLDYIEVTSQQSDKILIVYHAGMFLLFKSSLQEMSAFIRLYTTEVLSVPAINTLRFQWVITQIASWFIPSKKGYPEDLPAWALPAALQL